MMYVPYPPPGSLLEGEEGPTIRDCIMLLAILVLWSGTLDDS